MFEVWYRGKNGNRHILHGSRDKAELYAEQLSAKYRGKFTIIDPRGYTLCSYMGGRIIRDDLQEVWVG